MSAEPDRPPRRSRRLWWLAALVVVAAAAGTALFARTRPRGLWPQPVRPATAVGDAACIGCHQERATFEGTAHRLTSRTPSAQSIAGHFAGGRNVLHTPYPDLRFVMHAEPSGFYETAVWGRGADTTVRTERIAYVVGSDRKGQSYLYWHGDQLYQLPISYWKSLDTWINSPGQFYADGKAHFERVIAPRCFECHATYFAPIPDLTAQNRFDSTGALLGVTCERCHGAGAEHVRRERSFARTVFRARPEPAIADPARLSRERKIDVCAQCHGGLGQDVVPAFSYVAGQRLDDYVALPAPPPNADVDVHGNQVALLARSQCFVKSQMTCTTCHDVHRPQRDLVELSGRCVTCHQDRAAGKHADVGRPVVGRCVNCHMPLQTSNLAVTAIEGQVQSVQVRTHLIKVYGVADTIPAVHANPVRLAPPTLR